MSSGFGQRPFQFLHFPLLTKPFRFRCIQLVEFVFAVAVLQFFGFLLFFTDSTDSGEGIFVPKSARHLIHFISGFLRIGLRQFRIDAVGGNRLLGIFAASEGRHRQISGADTLATSNAIAGALRVLDFDLVITGRQAIDGDTAQVGPQIAEHLDLPQVTYVENLEFDGSRTFTIRKSTEDGFQLVQVDAPCVVTVLATANKARYMSVRGIVEAYNKEVEVWGFEHISVEEEKLGLKGSPTRVWKSFTKGAKAAGKVFEVEPAEAADIIVEKLKEKFII